MNFRQLQVFLAINETGSFSAAAKRLHLSQSAISRHAAMLEDLVGCPLLIRSARGAEATEAGAMLADYARRLFDIKDEARTALDALQNSQSGRLRIGASLTIGNYLLPQLLTTFHHCYPEVEIELSVANTATTQQELADHRIDLALTEGFVDNDIFQASAFSDDRLVAVAAPDAPMTRVRHLTLTQLVTYPCVMREPGSGTRAVVEKALADRGLALQQAMSMGSTEAVKRAVIASAGFTITSLRTVETELEAGTLVRLKPNHFYLERPLHLLERKNSEPSPTLARFMTLLNQSGTQ